MAEQLSKEKFFISHKKMRIFSGVGPRVSSASVAEERLVHSVHAGQTKKRLHSLMALVILLISSLNWPFIFLPERRLQQSYDGVLIVGASTVEGKALQNRDSSADPVHGNAKQTTKREKAHVTPSSPEYAELAFRQADNSPSSVLGRVPTAAVSEKGRSIASDASKEVLLSQRDNQRMGNGYDSIGTTEELRYWEHLAGEDTSALAFLLRKSLAQAISPSSRTLTSSNYSVASTCVDRPPPIMKGQSLFANNTSRQGTFRACTSDVCISRQQAKGQPKSLGNTDGKIGAHLAQEGGFSGSSSATEDNEFGVRLTSKEDQNTYESKRQSMSTRQADIQVPALTDTTDVTTEAFFSERHRQNSDHVLPADGATLQPTSSSFLLQDHAPSANTSGPLSKMMNKERIRDTLLHSHEAVVFKAPHFTAKIVRHVDTTIPKETLDTSSLEAHSKSSLLEENVSLRGPDSSKARPIFVLSRLQRHLDLDCATSGGTSAGTRPYMRHYRNNYYCFAANELDFSSTEVSCVDSCGALVSCRGAILIYYNSTWDRRRVNTSIKSGMLKSMFCVNSRLQARLNELCRQEFHVWRRVTNEEGCLHPDKINWDIPGPVCVDDCGRPAVCYGVPTQQGTLERLAVRVDEELAKFCVCDEKMGPGVAYKGCQTVTRSGRTCQKWNRKEPHDHTELLTSDHNYCRNPSNERDIWCYTTDPLVRFDYCDPLGLQKQYVQPGEALDIVITGQDLNPHVAIRFFVLNTGDPPTCSSQLTQSRKSDYFVLPRIKFGDNNIPLATVEDGTISRLTWKGVSISEEADGGVILCGCSFWYVVPRQLGATPCSIDGDYTILLGTLQVAGPRFPRDDEIRLSTASDVEFTIQGVGLSTDDILTVVAGTNPNDCTRSNRFSVQEEYLEGISQTALGADRTIQVRATIRHVSEDRKEAQTSRVRVPTTGKYMLCWSGARYNFASNGPAAFLVATGVNCGRHFVLVGSTSGDYSTLRGSVVYISTYLDRANIVPDAVTLRTASVPPCRGAELGRSTWVTRLDRRILADGEELYKATCVMDETARQVVREATVLDVCVKVEDEVQHLGLGTLGNTYMYSFSDFVKPPTLHPAVPDGVFTYQIGVSSPLGQHWSHTSGDNADNIIADPRLIFDTDPFPKALSLWVNRVQGYITAWAFDPADPSPDFVFFWKIRNAVTVALDACPKHVHLYVATSSPAQLHLFNVSNLGVTTLEHPIASLDGRAQGFVDLRSVVLVYSTSTADCTPLVLVLDKGSGVLWLFNADLTPVLSTNYMQGMSMPMSHPSSLSCTPRTSRSGGFLDVWDCVIADAGASSVIYFQINPSTRTIEFLDEYIGDGLKESKNPGLHAPNGVLAHRFANKTLVYVSEAESPDMHLLIVEENETSMRFEALITPAEIVPAIWHMFILPIQVNNDDPNDVLLGTLREGINGPMLQYGLLSGTGRIPDFFYKPREWYGVGDVHVLEPFSRGGGSLERIQEYTFDAVSRNSAYIASIATIDKKTGVIRLSISHVQIQEVTIKVFGIGLVNKQGTEFTFRVACRDGYYVKEGICVKCKAGFYNSMLLVAEKPQTAWSACQSCPPGFSTVAEGSVSANQCQCQKGYHLDDKMDCIPCPPGTWKDTVSDHGCQGKCPAHSSTDIQGATTPEERRCKCDPGYYAAGGGIGCMEAPKGTFSTGGYEAQLVQCPKGTSSDVDTPGVVKSTLRSCVCEKGYTPASQEALADPTSTASLLKAYLISIPEYAGLLDSQVCVKCEKDRYKDTVGNQRCERCPKSSYSRTLGATSLASCSQCEPGYYHSDDIDKPCKKCPKDHFCVGSEPQDARLVQYANKMIQCPPFSKTLLFTVNDHPLKCMCRIGYELKEVGANHEVTCLRTRLNHYKETLSNMPGTPCPSNTVTAMTKSTTLLDCVCPPGQHLNKAAGECEGVQRKAGWATVGLLFFPSQLCAQPCPIGYYCLGKRDLTDYRDSQPVKCPDLTSTNNVGASEYSQCLCDKGYQRETTQAGIQRGRRCSPCPINTYKDWVGDSMCRACGEHSGTRNEGATSAVQCLCFKGYYYSYTLSQCTACSGDSKRYCPGGEEDCDSSDPRCVDGKKPAAPQLCPERTMIPAGYDAASSVDDCKCEPGFGYKSGESSEEPSTCLPCPPGTYKPYIQNSACNSLCGASATSFSGARYQSQCFCEEGTFRVGETCHVCPAGAVCAGGLLSEAEAKLKADPQFTQITSADHVKPYAKPGFFLSKLRQELRSLSDWRFTPCPIEKACMERGRCVETMTEYLCSECKPNFTSNFAKGELCTACPSMGWNISLITLYYLGTLLFNIMMTYMNVAAGFNRKSIHSIVIKIASNFLTCMSIVGILDFKTIALPDWVAKLTTRVTERVTVKKRVQWLSVDCLLRQGFRLSYPESFFYTMLFYALLPIVLPIIATAIMYLLLRRTQAWYKASIQMKLNLIKQAEQCGLQGLSEQLRERCAEDRVFLIFRYIPLPGESRLTRLTKFMEDMIPIYVTVLFFLHSPTTRQMLSLLDCTYTDFGRGHKPKYFLRAAMSVECQIGLNKPYFKYLALGVAGLCTWSIGIPLSGFIVLYMKRKNLYSRATRLKYGFLHNGFLKKYWYWETVAFARKLLVLMSTSVGLIYSRNTVTSRVWTAMVVAIIFLVFHSIAQPFDKRSYLTLDRLETHSMGIWTVTCVVMAMMLGSDLGGNTNMILLCLVVLLVVLFLLDVAFSLMIAYFDNVRAQKTFFTVPLVGHVFKFFGRLSEKRRAHEPVVIYDPANEVFQLVAAKHHGWQFFRKKTEKIHLAERDYFIKILTETLWFAVAHMKLDVIPGAFLEFILLLGMTIHKVDENSQENNKSLQAIADGDLSRLAEWSRNERAKKEDAKKAAQQKKDVKQRVGNLYERLGKRLQRKKQPRLVKDASYAVRDDAERTAHEDEDPEATDETASTGSEQEGREHDSTDELETGSLADTLPSLADGSVGDLEDDLILLIDKEQMTTGIVLSELYLALLKLQQKDFTGIGSQYEAFRNQRLAAVEAYNEELLAKNNKLKLIRLAFQSLITNSPEELQRLGVEEEAFCRKREELAELNEQISSLNEKLNSLETNPEQIDTCPEEEWVNKEEYDCFLAEQDAASQDVENPEQADTWPEGESVTREEDDSYVVQQDAPLQDVENPEHVDTWPEEESANKEEDDSFVAQHDTASQELTLAGGDSEEADFFTYSEVVNHDERAQPQ